MKKIGKPRPPSPPRIPGHGYQPVSASGGDRPPPLALGGYRPKAGPGAPAGPPSNPPNQGSSGTKTRPAPSFAETRPEDVFGSVARNGPPVSLEDMEAGVLEEAKRRDESA